MFIPSVTGADASTVSAASTSVASTLSSDYQPLAATPTTEPVRHMLFGSITAVRSTIRSLHKRGYAEPNDWSQPISTGRPNEVMAILTKRIKLER